MSTSEIDRRGCVGNCSSRAHRESSVKGALGNCLAKGISQLRLRSIGNHIQCRHAANYSVQHRHSMKLTTPANKRVNGSDDPCKPQQGRFIEDCSDSDKGVCHCSCLDGFVSDFFCGLFVCLGLVFFVCTVLGSQQGGVLEILACAARRSVRCSWHVSSAYRQYIFHTPPSDCRTQLAPRR